ncbi:MAG: hypothetical protein A2Z35_04995 [Actinobacteria bacterium RBG_19FT_COMBO_36_27]|nr:MAG: hypothetical protein A2Z35_04995 [Actinobacteria bacterium RBG_19FT_COMBO_36_27]
MINQNVSDKLNLEIRFKKDLITLNSITKEDLELLRNWKNKNKNYFFYKKNISIGEQLIWFEEYLEREEDYIFIIKHKETKIGCMGFRVQGKLVDIYNIILGDIKFGGKGLMGIALGLMCSYIIDKYNNIITVKVLENNYNAIEWYRKNGFIEKSKRKDYVFMELDLNNFIYREYKIKTF